MKLRHCIAIAVGILVQVAFMYSVWRWTNMEVVGMLFLSLFAAGAGTALGLWLTGRKKPIKKQKPKTEPQIFTYTKQGVCLEGYYEQLNVG